MPMPLSDTKRIILAHAADHPAHKALPISTTVKAPAPTVNKSLEGLLEAGLLAEVAVSADDTPWRGTEGRRTTLIITTAGLAAIGLEADGSPDAERPLDANVCPASSSDSGILAPGTAPAKRSRKPATGPTPGKQDTIIAMLKGPEGCTIAEMMAATNWQAHSIRGFMSGTLKTRLGLRVTSEKEIRGERRYRVAKTEKGVQ